MNQYNLNRFLDAQLATYEGAMLELSRGAPVPGLIRTQKYL